MTINATTLFLLPYIIDKDLLYTNEFIDAFNVSEDFPYLQDKVFILYRCDDLTSTLKIMDRLKKNKWYYNLYSIRIDSIWYNLAIFCTPNDSDFKQLVNSGNRILTRREVKKIIKFWKDCKVFDIEDYIFEEVYNTEIKDKVPLKDCLEDSIEYIKSYKNAC